MNKNLAKLINEHGDDLMPYLKLRAKYVTDYCLGDTMPSDAVEGVSKAQIKALSRTGLVKIKDAGITLHDGERWHCDPPVIKSAYVRKSPRASGLDIYPAELVDLANLLGAEPDFATNTGKYLTIYNRFKSANHKKQDIDKAIEFLKKQRDEGNKVTTLNGFLSTRGFNYILSLMKNKESEKFSDRGEDEYVQEDW